MPLFFFRSRAPALLVQTHNRRRCAMHTIIMRAEDGREWVYTTLAQAKRDARILRAHGLDVRLYRRRILAVNPSDVLRDVVYGASYTPQPRAYVPWNTHERGSL
jgi:transposase InsO family protein